MSAILGQKIIKMSKNSLYGYITSTLFCGVICSSFDHTMKWIPMFWPTNIMYRSNGNLALYLIPPFFALGACNLYGFNQSKQSKHSVFKRHLLYPFVTSAIYALWLAMKNKSLGEYVKLPEGSGQASLLRNYVLAILVGTLWYGQFFFYNLGHVRMGEQYAFSSWAIHMTMLVLFSTLTGMFFREWKGCTRKTIAYVVMGVVVLVAAVMMLTYGNQIGSEVAAH